MNLTIALTDVALENLKDYLRVPEEHYEAIQHGRMFQRTDLDASLRIIGARRALDLGTHKSACVIHPEIEAAKEQVRERRKVVVAVDGSEGRGGHG